MLISSRIYRYQGVDYPCSITYKRIKNINMRMDGERKSLRVSAPFHTPIKTIDRAVMAYFPRLVKRCKSTPPKWGEDFAYILGEKKDYAFKDEEAFYSYLKRASLPIFEARVRYYEKIMKIKPAYKVKSRPMKSRYGVNSKRTHTITLQSQLLCFPMEVIDSVVVHELSHHFVFDHSQKFYSVLLSYCPNYYLYHDRLRKGIYAPIDQKP